MKPWVVEATIPPQPSFTIQSVQIFIDAKDTHFCSHFCPLILIPFGFVRLLDSLLFPSLCVRFRCWWCFSLDCFHLCSKSQLPTLCCEIEVRYFRLLFFCVFHSSLLSDVLGKRVCVLMVSCAHTIRLGRFISQNAVCWAIACVHERIQFSQQYVRFSSRKYTLICTAEQSLFLCQRWLIFLYVIKRFVRNYKSVMHTNKMKRTKW